MKAGAFLGRRESELLMELGDMKERAGEYALTLAYLKEKAPGRFPITVGMIETTLKVLGGRMERWKRQIEKRRAWDAKKEVGG